MSMSGCQHDNEGCLPAPAMTEKAKNGLADELEREAEWCNVPDDHPDAANLRRTSALLKRAAAALRAREAQREKLWLWRNFVDGEPQYWAFDNAYPCFPNGDPITRGEPCGYALVKQSTKGRHDVSDEQVIAAIKRGLAPSEGAQRDAERYLILRALGCVYADKPFSHGDALCTPGRVGGDYADSFADAALSRRPA